MDEHVVYLSLGSNMGNRAANLKAAVGQLTPQLRVLSVSKIYETPPWGFTEQAEFLNQVLMVYTYLKPQAMLDHLKRLETALGRVPSFPNGPRLIDIDILFYDDLVLDTSPLVIPHPRLHERAFVLVPLAEIAPDHVHPVLGKPVHALLDEVDRSDIKLFK